MFFRVSGHCHHTFAVKVRTMFDVLFVGGVGVVGSCTETHKFSVAPTASGRSGYRWLDSR